VSIHKLDGRLTVRFGQLYANIGNDVFSTDYITFKYTISCIYVGRW